MGSLPQILSWARPALRSHTIRLTEWTAGLAPGRSSAAPMLMRTPRMLSITAAGPTSAGEPCTSALCASGSAFGRTLSTRMPELVDTSRKYWKNGRPSGERTRFRATTSGGRSFTCRIST